MTYDPNIPLNETPPKDSAVQIKTNFAQFAAIFSNLVAGVNYNHMPFTSNPGKHGAVIFQNQSADPGVTEDLDALYAKNATSNASTEPQLFAQIPKFLPTALDTTNAPNTPMQLTYNSVGTAGPVFYSFLSGGYLVYFGSVTAQAVSPATVTLAPIPKSLLIAVAMPNSVETGSQHKAIKMSSNITSTSTFDVYSTGFFGSYDFNWIAIGVA
jgi:hypothetical protein